MALLVAAPLFRRSLAVEGYVLRCESRQYSLLDVIATTGISSISVDKPLIVPLTEAEIADCPPLDGLGSPRQLMPLLPEFAGNRATEPLRRQGYHIVVQGQEPQCLSSADYWLLGKKQMSAPGRKEFVAELRREHRVTAIATGINGWDLFDEALKDDFELLDGKFFFIPALPADNAITPIKANLIRLLNIVRSEDYEFSTVTNVVRQDPALTVSLMRFINSPYIGVRHRVKSIQQAVTLLGQDQVRKWVTAAVYKSLGTDRPGELTRIALTRAKFAENLSASFKLSKDSDSLFLLGLFSMLDTMLGVSMAQALDLVPVTSEMMSALLELSGPYAPVLQLMLSYEVADWETVDQCCVFYDLEKNNVLNAYLEALGWYNDLTYSAPPAREAAYQV